jgi:hypothetical protein
MITEDRKIVKQRNSKYPGSNRKMFHATKMASNKALHVPEKALDIADPKIKDDN